MFATWRSAVRTLMVSSLAISALLWPTARRRRTFGLASREAVGEGVRWNYRLWFGCARSGRQTGGVLQRGTHAHGGEFGAGVGQARQGFRATGGE